MGRLDGDTFARYLALSDREVLIEQWVAHDPSGRHVAYVEAGRLMLHDVDTGARVDLSARGADTRDDGLAFRGHRAASFGDGGKYIVYLKKKKLRGVAVVRELATGHEVEIDPGPVELWRAELGPGAHWVVLRVIGDDSNGNGRLDWPVPPAGNRGCAGPIPSYDAWIGRGDKVTTLVARAAGGPTRFRPELVTPLGRQLVHRRASGALELESFPGRREVVPAACEAKLVRVDADRQRLFAICTADGKRGPLFVVERGKRRDLPIELAPVAVDWTRDETERLWPVYPGLMAALVDLDDLSIHQLRSGDRVAATHGTRALVIRGRELVVYDASTKKSTGLDAKTDPMPKTLHAGPVVVVTPWIVDLALPRLIGRGPPGLLAVRSDGHVLAPSTPGTAERFASGQLAWVSAGKSRR